MPGSGERPGLFPAPPNGLRCAEGCSVEFVPIEGGPSMSVLFTPLRVGDRDLANRIVIAPMCQYSAVRGLHDRLASDPPRPSCPLGCGAADHGGDRGRCPKGGSPTPMSASGNDATRSGDRPDAGERPTLVRHAHRHPTGACRPQGLDRGAMERRRADPARRCERLADGRAVRGSVRSRANIRRSRSTAMAWRGCARPSPRRHGAPRDWGSMPSRSMAPTAICCTSSCRRFQPARR